MSVEKARLESMQFYIEICADSFAVCLTFLRHSFVNTTIGNFYFMAVFQIRLRQIRADSARTRHAADRIHQ